MAAGLNPIIEAPNLLDQSSQKPADIFIPNWSLGKGIAIDVRVTSPLQKSIVKHAAKEAGKAAQMGFDNKMKKYRVENKDNNSFHFLPLSVEAFGLWHPESSSFIHALADKLAQRQTISRNTARRQLYQRLSIALQSHTANAILHRYDYVDCAYNGAFFECRPTAD
jgi:hypothetical protein